MGRKLLVWVVCLGIAGVVGTLSRAAEQWGTVETVTPTGKTAPITTGNNLASSTELTIRQRRAMGITVANVRQILAAKQKAGELEGKSTETLAVEVLDELVAANPKAFDDPGIDWDKLIEFIEKLIPLILKILALFGL